ncbi:MAG: GGDEF domain-containing protein [Candidatus Nealsonbacteria bacterium]|nr:GGDEF domain-containing protein [Candidatus Nealsonbacteria bacterium]
MSSLAYIAPWVLGSVGVGLVIGFFMGRGRVSTPRDVELARRERQAALKALLELLRAAERLSTDVESHNTEIQESAEQVGSLQATGEMESVKQALLGHMTSLMTSNRQMQDDLTCTQYRLEEQAQEIDHARHEARTDAMTNVANRKAFDEKLHLLLDTWKRQRETFVLILIDLDQFKRINDSHGHQAGDRILKKVGAWLKKSVREGDLVGRYGGDEFAVLLPRTTLQVGFNLAETLRTGVADRASRVALRRGEVSVSLSIGVAVPCIGDTVETILARADEALYRSKHLGRNQVNCQLPQQDQTESEEPVLAGDPC